MDMRAHDGMMLGIEYGAADNSVVALCAGRDKSSEKADENCEQFVAQRDSPKRVELEWPEIGRYF